MPSKVAAAYRKLKSCVLLDSAYADDSNSETRIVHPCLRVKMDTPENSTSYWDHLMSLNDKRLENWLLMVDPKPTVYISFVYIVFCLVAPKILQGKSFYIDPIVRLYNLSMVIVNFYIAYELYVSTIGYYYWPCEPVDYTLDPRSMRIASAFWLYYFSKIIELLDTVFFILRGKYNQVTFLHVYHHSTMPVMFWIGCNFAAGGNSVFGAALNSVIHVIMYTYYYLASFGPRFRQYLWWKRYLTQIQLTQFMTNLGFLINFMTRETCNFPLWMAQLMFFYMTSFLVLFGNFYVMSYVKGESASDDKKKS